MRLGGNGMDGLGLTSYKERKSSHLEGLLQKEGTTVQSHCWGAIGGFGKLASVRKLITNPLASN